MAKNALPWGSSGQTGSKKNGGDPFFDPATQAVHTIVALFTKQQNW